MSLNSYTKSDSQPKESDDYVFLRDYKPESKKIGETIKDIPSGTYEVLKEASNSSKIANFLIPTLFIAVGAYFIYKEVYPDIQQAIQQNSGYLSQGNVSPVSDEYIDLSTYVSRPIDFPSLTKNALQEHLLQEDTVSLNFTETFYLSIPALNINRLPVQANVDSTSEASYLPVLETKLGHFKNTGLPISDVPNNMLVYGHSASPNFGPQRDDPYVAFSYLSELKIGDEIIIEIAGETFKYKMSSSKIVKPTDTSVITGTKGKHTLTLVTCFPAGSNENRYVAIARPVE